MTTGGELYLATMSSDRELVNELDSNDLAAELKRNTQQAAARRELLDELSSNDLAAELKKNTRKVARRELLNELNSNDLVAELARNTRKAAHVVYGIPLWAKGLVGTISILLPILMSRLVRGIFSDGLKWAKSSGVTILTSLSKVGLSLTLVGLGKYYLLPAYETYQKASKQRQIARENKQHALQQYERSVADLSRVNDPVECATARALTHHPNDTFLMRRTTSATRNLSQALNEAAAEDGLSPQPSSGEEGSVSIAEKKSQLRLLNLHMMSNIALSLFTFSSRTTLLGELVHGDSARMVSILSTWASSLGALEFLFNPTVGRLSDHYGRKPFMMLSPIACIVLKTWCALKPSVLALTLEKILCDALRTMSGSTMCKAALSDLCRGEEYSLAIGNLYSWAGVAIIGGPFVSSLIPNPRVTFGISAVWAVVQFMAESLYLKETLPPQKRTRAFEGYVNPFSVTKLFTTNSKLRNYSLIGMLQCMVEPKNLSDISAMFQMEKLKWSASKRDIFVSFLGLSFLVSGPVTKQSIERFGRTKHTSIMHYLSILQYAFRALPYEWATWLGVVVMMLSETKMNGVAALRADEASRNGMGKGEYSGLDANLRALMVFVSPFVLGGLYRYGASRKPTPMYGLPFLGAIAAMACSELVLQNTPAGEEDTK